MTTDDYYYTVVNSRGKVVLYRGNWDQMVKKLQRQIDKGKMRYESEGEEDKPMSSLFKNLFNPNKVTEGEVKVEDAMGSPVENVEAPEDDAVIVSDETIADMVDEEISEEDVEKAAESVVDDDIDAFAEAIADEAIESVEEPDNSSEEHDFSAKIEEAFEACDEKIASAICEEPAAVETAESACQCECGCDEFEDVTAENFVAFVQTAESHFVDADKEIRTSECKCDSMPITTPEEAMAAVESYQPNLSNVYTTEIEPIAATYNIEDSFTPTDTISTEVDSIIDATDYKQGEFDHDIAEAVNLMVDDVDKSFDEGFINGLTETLTDTKMADFRASAESAFDTMAKEGFEGLGYDDEDEAIIMGEEENDATPYSIVGGIHPLYDYDGIEICIGDIMCVNNRHDKIGVVVGLGDDVFYTEDVNAADNNYENAVIARWDMHYEPNHYYHFRPDTLDDIIDDITSPDITVEELTSRFRKIVVAMRDVPNASGIGDASEIGR